MRAYVPKHQSMQLKNTTLVSSGDSEMLRVLTSIWMWTRIFEILLKFSLSIFQFHEALQNGIIISFFFCRRCNILMVWLGTGRGKWTKYISYAQGLHDTIMWEYRLFIMRYRRRTFGLRFCSFFIYFLNSPDVKAVRVRLQRQRKSWAWNPKLSEELPANIGGIVNFILKIICWNKPL